MLHDLIQTWFYFVRDWGYLGVFILMAMESSIIPVPSEVVLPPAAYWASQGKLDFSGVVLAGVLGSYLGSIISYYLARIFGVKIVYKYSKYFFVKESHLKMGESWMERHGVFGIFIARLLPVIRHLISIPAGLFGVKPVAFSLATLLGAGLWCWILSYYGQMILGDSPALLDSPAEMVFVLKSKFHWILLGVFALVVLYVPVRKLKS